MDAGRCLTSSRGVAAAPWGPTDLAPARRGYALGVRWESLFADLQGQWDAAQRVDDEARIADLAELEMGRTWLADRVRARVGASLTVRLTDGSEVTGLVLDAAPQWLLLRTGERRSLVPVAAVGAAWPLGPVAPEAGVVESRLRVSHVLRAIAREGVTVLIRSTAVDVRGQIVRVGADHLDVVRDEAPGLGGGAALTVALGGLLVVESL